MPLFQKVIITILNCSLFQKLVMTTCRLGLPGYDHLVIMPLFREVIMTNLTCYASVPITLPPIFPTKPLLWKTPPPEL